MPGREKCDGEVQLYLGPQHGMASSESGLVTIFNKQHGTVEYQGDHHDDGHGPLYGSKILTDTAVTGTDDGSVRILEMSSVPSLSSFGEVVTASRLRK